MIAPGGATALVVLACLGAPSRAEEPRPLRIVPAMQAIQLGATTALWAPDLRSILGHDREGQRLWRVATGDPGGPRDLARLGDNLLAEAGGEALLIAPGDGRVLGRRSIIAPVAARAAPTTSDLPVPEPCRVTAHGGACALRCPCSFEVVRCDDLSPLGPAARLPAVDPMSLTHVGASRCPSFSGALLGRAEDVVITSFPDTPATAGKPFFGVSEIVVARDARTGEERWRSSEPGFFDEALAGVAADGVCYAGSRAGTLTVFDCQRATVLWRRPLARARGSALQIEVVGDGLLVRDGVSVGLFDPRTGHARWQVDLPPDRLALLAGSAGPADGGAPERSLPSAIRSARILRLDDGARLGEIVLPTGTERWPRRFADPAGGTSGWIVMSPKRVEAYDERGQLLGGVGSSHTLTDYVAGDAADVAVWDPLALTVATLTSTRPATAWNLAPARVIAFEGALGPGGLVVLVDGRGPWDPKDPTTFGEARFYRIP